MFTCRLSLFRGTESAAGARNVASVSQLLLWGRHDPTRSTGSDGWAERDLERIIPHLPTDRLVLETDAPHLEVTRTRGSTEGTLEAVAVCLAELLSISPETVVVICRRNTVSFPKKNRHQVRTLFTSRHSGGFNLF